MRSLQNYKTYTNLSVLLDLITLRTRKILSLIIKELNTEIDFLDNEIEGPLLTYDQMSGNDLLSCTNSLVTIMVVINHRNIPRGPICLHRRRPSAPLPPTPPKSVVLGGGEVGGDAPAPPPEGIALVFPSIYRVHWWIFSVFC